METYRTIHINNITIHRVPMRKEGNNFVYSFHHALMIEHYMNTIGQQVHIVDFQEIVKWYEGMDMRELIKLSQNGKGKKIH